jgi:hypothetical protein
MMAAQEAPQAWHDIVCGTLKANSVPLVATERDPVLIMDRFMRGLGTKG